MERTQPPQQRQHRQWHWARVCTPTRRC